jgi:hypothetical protein
MDTQKNTYRAVRCKEQANKKFHSKRLRTTTLTKDPNRSSITKEYNKKIEKIKISGIATSLKNDLKK